MEAVGYSEIIVSTYQTTWRHDLRSTRILTFHRCAELKMTEN